MSTADNILYRSEAYLNIQKQRIFLNSIKIYQDNYSELIKAFNKHNKLDLAKLLDAYQGRKRLNKLHSRISRYLHNYLASTFTLIHNSSVYYKKCFKPKNKIIEYEDKIKNEVNNKPVKRFIDDLRNYIQHKEIPNIITSTAYKPYPSLDYETYLKFQVEDLMSYNNWSTLSKKYIKDNAKSLVIQKAIEEFHDIFMSFTNWFIQQTNDCLIEDRKEVEKLKQQLKIENLKVLIRLFFGLPDLNNSIFEKAFLPKFNKGERLAIIKEKNNIKRAEKIIKTINKYSKISINFETNVLKLYR